MPTPNRRRVARILAALFVALAFLLVVQPAAPLLAQDGGSHRNFLPLINGENSPVPAPGAVVLSTHPYITQKVTTTDGVRCVLFSVTGAVPAELTLTLSFTVDTGSVEIVDAGAACDTAAAPPHTGATITQTPPGCLFTPNAATPPHAGETVTFTCRYTESPDAVYFTDVEIDPHPLGSYDANFDGVQDTLAPGVDQRIIIWLTDGPSQFDRTTFLNVGGRDLEELPHLNMMIGTLSGETARTTLRTALGMRVILIGADQDYAATEISRSQRSTGPVAAGPTNLPWLDGAQSAPAATVKTAVAVFDTGIDSAHPTLSAKITHAFDATAPGSYPADEEGQGTHVASIIAGEESGGSGSFRGVAPQVDLIPVRIGTGERWRLSDFLRGIEWVIDQRTGHGHAIAVVHNSITAPGIVNPFWTAALRTLTDQGVVVVSAAGDDGNETVGAPADDPAVITVGAANARADLLDESSQGAPYHAPVKPDLLAPGRNIYAAKAGTNGFENRTGTEMAAAIVSGAAAQLVLMNSVPARGDEDDDGISDNDPWNGRDDNRDDILDGDLGAWDASITNLRKVKSLLLMSTAPPSTAAGGQAEPTARHAKTTATGYGVFDARALADAFAHDFCAMDRGSFSGEAGATRVWIRRLYLHADRDYTLTLDGPHSADYDLFLYRSLPDAVGNPVVARAVGSDRLLQSTTDGADEQIDGLRVRADGVYYAVVRHVSGAGEFQLSLTDPVTWTVLVYAAAELPGEENLDEAAFALLNRLESVGSGFGSTQEVQVLALFDYDRLNWSQRSRVQVDGINNGDAALFCVRKDLLAESTNRSVIIPAGRVFAGSDNEINMGAPETLAGFIAWSRRHFPATHTALVLWGDSTGYGWKSDPALALGPGHDTRATSDAAYDSQADAFTVAELADTIANALPQRADATPAPLDLLILDSGQSANLDVAYQFLKVANNLVAWETPVDRNAPGYANLYTGLINLLRCGADSAGWACDRVDAATGSQLAAEIVRQYPATPGQTLTAITLSNAPGDGACATLTKLASCVSDLAVSLIQSIGDPGDLATAADNAQVILAEQVRAQTVEMADRTYIDLYDFARRVVATPALSASHAPAAAIVQALAAPGAGPILARSSDNADHGGLAFFFPKRQTVAETQCNAAAMSDCGWDNPLPSPWLYADSETFAAVAAAGVQASRATGEVTLDFVQQKQWDEFLERYYAPVAAVCVQSGDGDCMRTAVIRIGDTVRLSARGSSDIDPTGAGLRFYWDMDLTRDDPAPLPDHGDGAAPVDEPCSEDCDRDGVDSTDDDPDVLGPDATWTCEEAGQSKQIRLMVHDDYHLTAGALPPSDGRHWNVDATVVTIYCAVEPQFNADADLLLNSSKIDYQLVVVANRDVDADVTGRLVNPLPAALTLFPGSIEAAVGSATYISATHTLEWNGPLSRNTSVTINYQAAVDNSLVPLADPYVVNRADFFDGIITRTLTVTTPAAAVELMPRLLSPGETMTYTVKIPARTGLAAPEEISLQYFGDTTTAALDAYDAALPSMPSAFDRENNILIWPAVAAPDTVATFRFSMRIAADAECGANGIRLFLWPVNQTMNTPSFTVGNCAQPEP